MQGPILECGFSVTRVCYQCNMLHETNLLASRLGPNNPECLHLLKPAGFQERKILSDVWLSPDRDFCERYRFICNPGSLFDSILSPHITHITEQLSIWSLKSSISNAEKCGDQGYFLPKALVNHVIRVLVQSSEFWKLAFWSGPRTHFLIRWCQILTTETGSASRVRKLPPADWAKQVCICHLFFCTWLIFLAAVLLRTARLNRVYSTAKKNISVPLICVKYLAKLIMHP